MGGVAVIAGMPGLPDLQGRRHVWAPAHSFESVAEVPSAYVNGKGADDCTVVTIRHGRHDCRAIRLARRCGLVLPEQEPGWVT